MKSLHAKLLGGQAEQAERGTADAAFLESQTSILAKIGAEWKRSEADRMESWLSLSRMVAEYVNNELAHHGNDRATYTTAVLRVEGALSAFTENAKASVSRLLATAGLLKLLVEETDADDAAGIMAGLNVSAVKLLVKLVERDKSAPGLAYQWKDAAVEKGPVLVCTVSESGMTVADLKDAVSGVLSAAAEQPAVGSNTAPVEGGRKRGRKASAPAAKAASRLGKVLSDASQASVRREAIEGAVKAGSVSVADVVTAAGASDAARRLIVGSASNGEVEELVKGWLHSGQVRDAVALFKAIRSQLKELLVKRKPLTVGGGPQLFSPAG